MHALSERARIYGASCSAWICCGIGASSDGCLAFLATQFLGALGEKLRRQIGTDHAGILPAAYPRSKHPVRTAVRSIPEQRNAAAQAASFAEAAFQFQGRS
jgi:hypothetical protein